MEVLVNNEPTIVDQAIIVDGEENILVYVSVASCDEDPCFDLELVLLSLLPLLGTISFLLSIFLILASVLASSCVIAAHV